MWRHITIVLFCLIVEDHRLWFVGMKLYIFDASLICRRWTRLRGQSCDNLSASRSLPSITKVWPSVFYFEYCRFLLYRTEPSVKIWSSRLWCDFIAVPLILADLFLVLLLNHWWIYCAFGWICHNLPRLWQIHNDQIENRAKDGIWELTVLAWLADEFAELIPYL